MCTASAAWTGAEGAPIRENLRALVTAYPTPPVTVRTPVIPGFNDEEDALADIRRFVRTLPGVRWQKLPYHTYGAG